MDSQYFTSLESRIPHGKTRTRFAPSPTGYMHVGNLRTALYAYLVAKRDGGSFILRIEDTDQTRYVPDAVGIIFETLKQTGLTHDEGPDVGGPVGPYIQSERRELYGRFAGLLVEKGGAYRCFCGKEEHEEEGAHPGPRHACACSRLAGEESEARSNSEPFVVRQRMPREGTTSFDDAVYGRIEVPNEELEDQVLLKSDGLPTYNFANVVDDHLMGVTHVVRGSEYLSSSPKYNLLYSSFGWTPPVYIHCPPVMKNASEKLSKRNGDASFQDLIAKGYLSDAVLNFIALLGWSPGGEQELFTLPELCEAFSVEGISKSPAIFDGAKLRWLNGEYVKKLDPAAFYKAARPWLDTAVEGTGIDPAAVGALVQPRCEVLSDIPEMVDFLRELPDYDNELYTHKKMKTTPESSLPILREASETLSALSDWSAESIHSALFGLVEKLAVKNGQVLWPVRVALSGKPSTPGGGVELAAILGREETLRRISKGISQLSGEQ